MSDAQDDRDGAALTDRAHTLMQLERYPEALVVLARALPIAPDPAWVFSAMAVCHTNLGQFAEALQLADQCLSAEPGSYNGHLMRADALLGLGRWAEAEQAARAAIAADPEWRKAWDLLIKALHGLKRYGEAREAAEKLAEIAPDRGEAHHWLGLFAIIERQWAEAERHCRKALELEPDSHGTVTNLAVVAARLGRWRESLDLNVRAIEMAPADADMALRNLVTEIEVSISRRAVYRLWVAGGILTSIPFAAAWAPTERRAPYFVIAAVLALASGVLLAVRLAAAPPIARRFYWRRRRDTWRRSAAKLALTIISFAAAWTLAGAVGRLIATGPSVAAIACALAGAACIWPFASRLWRRWNEPDA
jgi:tetratricopeptide (TPR) repeat protein